MSPHPKNPKLTFSLSLLIILSLSTPSLSTTIETVYDLLTQYGLPIGLLPDSVQSYTLNSDDGHFSVTLPKPCYIKFDYLVYYDRKITGRISYGSISDLKGIQVQRFFLWLGVDQIRVDLPASDSIYFQVGIVNKKLGIGQFKTVRSCRKNSLLQLTAPENEAEMITAQ